MIWSAYVEYDARDVPHDVYEHAMELLPPDGTPNTAPNGNFALYLNIETATAELAAAEALRTTGDIIRTVYGNCSVHAFEVMTLAERERRNREPAVPDLAGSAEVAEILDIQRGGVAALTKSALFQQHVQPVADLRSGRIYSVDQIRRFRDVWERRPGRPRKTT